MPSVDELEKLAFDLPEAQRAMLAAHLLDSLPPVWDDADAGLGEARRRDAEFEANPSVAISLEELDRLVKQRRR